MRIRVLGSVDVLDDGGVVVVTSAAQRRLVAMLTVHLGAIVSAERLADVLGVSLGALRTTVSRLRKLVGDDVVVTAADGYLLEVSDLDAVQFETLIGEAARADVDRMIELLGEALGLWRGRAFGEFADEDWARPEAVRLTELQASAFEDRVEALLVAGRFAEATAALPTQIAAFPLRDRVRGLLMRALAAQGRHTEALRAYQDYRGYLGEEIGTEPSRELRDLEARIAAGWHDTAEPISGAAQKTSGNLPRQMTSFVGRDREVAQVVAALGAAPVVTLTGVGGVGKTRLALEAAAASGSRYRDGVWLVELGSVRDSTQVVDAVTAVFSLNVTSGARADDVLVEFLRNKQLVLVVDNCEHLIVAAAALVSAVVASCLRVTVLATSREGLAVAGEQIIAVPPLDAPSASDPFAVVAVTGAVRLFVDRAVAAHASFELNGTNASAVAEVCRRLDGIPLAIELAAARVASMSPAELAGRLGQRFRVLAGGRRGAVERHQTLRAAIDWSYELLSVAEQSLLVRLSVFVGGFTLDAAEAVCAGEGVEVDDILDVVAGLVARSLVVADEGPVTRYRLLETIRQYGEERLDPDEAGRLAARHGEYYAQLAEGYFHQLWGAEQLEWARRVVADSENLTAAMNWAIDTDNADIGMRIGASVYSGTQVGHPVTIAIEPALALSGAPQHPLYPRALAKAADEAASRGDRQLVEQRCNEALEAERRLGEPSGGLLEAWLCAASGYLEMSYGLSEAAAAHLERGGEVALAGGNPAYAAIHFARAASLRAGSADKADVIDAATQALTLARRSGAPLTVNFALGTMANAVALVDPERARTLLAEAIEAMERLGYQDAIELTQLATVATRLGDWRLTLQLARRAIPRLHWQGDLPNLLLVFNVSALALSESRPDTAARFQGAARTIARTFTATPGPPSDGPARAGSYTRWRREATRRLAATLTGDQLAQRRREGEAMDLDDAVAYALAEIDNTLTDPTSPSPESPERPACGLEPQPAGDP